MIDPLIKAAALWSGLFNSVLGRAEVCPDYFDELERLLMEAGASGRDVQRVINNVRMSRNDTFVDVNHRVNISMAELLKECLLELPPNVQGPLRNVLEKYS